MPAIPPLSFLVTTFCVRFKSPKSTPSRFSVVFKSSPFTVLSLTQSLIIPLFSPQIPPVPLVAVTVPAALQPTILPSALLYPAIPPTDFAADISPLKRQPDSKPKFTPTRPPTFSPLPSMWILPSTVKSSIRAFFPRYRKNPKSDPLREMVKPVILYPFPSHVPLKYGIPWKPVPFTSISAAMEKTFP